MKPTQQEIIEFAKQATLGTALSHGGGELRIFIEGADWHEELLRFAELLLERFGAGGGAPVMVVEVEGGCWNTTESHNFFGIPDGTYSLYTHSSPADLRAEYVRGLDDAAMVCKQERIVKGGEVFAAKIEALKGKQ